MIQIQPTTGLLLPADPNRPIQHVRIRPDNTLDMAKLIGCQWIEVVRTPLEDVIMIVNEVGRLEGDRLNPHASNHLYPGPIMGDVLLFGTVGPATTSLSEQALDALAQVFDIEPGRSALDVASAALAEEEQ